MIIKSYLDDKLSIKKIMKNTSLSRAHINKVLMMHQIPIFGHRAQAMRGSLLGDDLAFFENMNEHASYILGVILGDGCVQHNALTREYSLNITSEDRDILESTNVYFGGQFPIYTIKKSKALSLTIWSKTLTELLFQKFYLRGVKDHNLPWIKLPFDMYQFMISGLHSTDGSNYNQTIKSTHKGKKYLNCTFVWNYTSVCFEFITKVKDHIEKMVPDVRLSLAKRVHPKGNISYSIRTSGKRAVKLCDWMYANTSQLTRCERKYQRYLVWKTIYSKNIPLPQVLE